jgi:hypothetical protein
MSSVDRAHGSGKKASLPFTAAQSLEWFGYYVTGLALGLLLFPGFLLGLFGLAAPTEPWVRVLAIPLFNLSIFVIMIGRNGTRSQLWLSVLTRSWVLPVMAALVLAGLAPAIILLFGLVEVIGAGLTALALRAEDADATA